jgi:cytochrome P450
VAQVPSVPVHMLRTPFDPVDELARRRAEEPVSRVEATLGPIRYPAWLITKYDDVRAVLSDATSFTNSNEAVRTHVAAVVGTETAARMPLGGPSLISYDPPHHTRLRRMVSASFTVKRVHALQPRIEAIVTEHLDAMEAAGGPVDLVQAFALPVPSLVICELLGVPYDDRAELQRRSRAMVTVDLDLEERRALSAESRAYMSELLRRHRAHPDEELVALGTLLLIAGHETTANMLGLGTLLLLRHPDQLALLRDDPGIAERAVEELVRYLSIVHTGITRTAVKDRRYGHQGRRRSRVLAFFGQPRRGGHRRPGCARPDPQADVACRVRAWRPSLPGRAAGPDGDARRRSRAVAPVPRTATGRPVRRGPVQFHGRDLRSPVAARQLVAAL